MKYDDIQFNMVNFESDRYEIYKIESDLKNNIVHIYFYPKISSINITFTIYPN